MEYIRIVVTCAAAIAAGIMLGNSAVVFFNRMPGKWLCEYGKEPDEELAHPTRQRINSWPWKYFFSCLFVMASIKTAMDDPGYALISMITCWILTEMAIADARYMIVPDQLVILLMVAAVGFVPYHDGGPYEGVWGGLIGFGVMLVTALLGRIIYRRAALGGGDIKVFGALGLCTGVDGILSVFILSTFLCAIHMAWLLMRKKAKRRQQRPLIPYVAISSSIYLVILHGIGYNIMAYL
ncbi:MAG: prepilin peptidase [Anaerovoracaceae bacterium]